MTALLSTHAHTHGGGFDLPEILLHTALDFLKLLPFLFLAYLLTEWLSRSAGVRVRYAISRGGRLAPLLGALLGAIPQCGFSAATAGLYAARVLSLGTLISVFLSTSDEMLPILLAGGASPVLALKLIGFKCLCGAVLGFAVDGVLSLGRREGVSGASGDGGAEGALPCTCGCCGGGERSGIGGLLVGALCHTARVSVWILVTMLAFECAVHAVGTEAIAEVLTAAGPLTVLLSALLGLIPNCAVSVVLTELWLAGAIGAGAMLAGLLVGAGVGLLVLFRTNRPMRENFLILALLFGLGVGVGLLLELTGLGALLFAR